MLYLNICRKSISFTPEYGPNVIFEKLHKFKNKPASLLVHKGLRIVDQNLPGYLAKENRSIATIDLADFTPSTGMHRLKSLRLVRKECLRMMQRPWPHREGQRGEQKGD